MPYPFDDKDWTVQCDGQLTFFGVLSKHFDEIGEKYHLCTATKLSYARDYERHILPRLNDRPLESYTAEDFEQVIVEISNSKEFAKSTLQRFRLLISRVIGIAVQKENMANPLWGVYFVEVITPKQVEERERKVLPKSFSPLQHCMISEAIYSNARKFEKGMGLMLVHECGLRPKEAAGASFGDFKEPGDGQDFATLAIHTSTKGQSHERQDKLKTPNGYRMCVLGPQASEIVSQKKNVLQRKIETAELVFDPAGVIPALDAIPIASSSTDYLVPCSSVQLSTEFRRILRDSGYENDDYIAAQRIVESKEYAEANRRVTAKELGFAEEKDPTAYLCRRNCCTVMHIVGCTPEERQYAMGHRIENPAVDRRDFRNDDLFKVLAEKLNKCPGTNPGVLEPKVITMNEQRYCNPDFHRETVKIPTKKVRKIVICAVSHEPQTPVEIEVSMPKGVNASCKYYECPSALSQRREVNVLNDYHTAHRKAKAFLAHKKNEQMKNEDEA